MNYFKHADLAKLYHVSLKTVHNWISGAKDKKLNLSLIETKSGTYVADTAENIHVLESLAAKGKKYRNTLHHKLIRPSSQFYEIYSRRQIVDIINNLEVHKELSMQYNYMNEGARQWQAWMQRLETDASGNILKGTRELIHDNLPALDSLLAGRKRVNIIDLGVGNAYPVKELLGHFLDKGMLHRYIALDISKDMLELAETNIRSWYGDRIPFEGYVRDMTFERFDDLMVEDMTDKQHEETVNLVLLLGLTPSNFRQYNDAYKTVYNSMRKNDLILHIDKIDSEAARRYFDFEMSLHTNALSLLGLTPDLYEVEAGFDPKKLMRYMKIRLKTAVVIEFEFSDTTYRVMLEKNEAVLILRIWHFSPVQTIQEFSQIGFVLLHSNMTNNRQFFLSVSGVDSNSLKLSTSS